MEAIFGTRSFGISHAVTSTASAAVLLPTKDVLDSLPMGLVQIRIVNEGPSIAFIAVGTDSGLAATLPTTTAAKTCDAVLPGSDTVLTLTPFGAATTVYFSAICRAAGTATLSVYIGKGQ